MEKITLSLTNYQFYTLIDAFNTAINTADFNEDVYQKIAVTTLLEVIKEQTK